MSVLPRELRDLIASGPMAHLSTIRTIDADGSPQVIVVCELMVLDNLQRWEAEADPDGLPETVLPDLRTQRPGVVVGHRGMA